MGGQSLDVNTVSLDLTGLLEAVEVGHNVGGKSVLTGNEDELSAGELEFGSTQGLGGVSDVSGLGSDGEEDGANVDTSGLTESLSVSVSHTGLESISTGAGEHLVDTDNVPGVDSNSEMEAQLTGVVLHVLVGSNTGGFKSLGGDLLLFARNEMDSAGEFIPVGFLHTAVVHSNLRVGDTTVESRLGVRLVLLVSVAT